MNQVDGKDQKNKNKIISSLTFIVVVFSTRMFYAEQMFLAYVLDNCKFNNY